MKIKMSEKKSMKGMKWIIVLLALFLVAGVFVGAAGAGVGDGTGTGGSDSGGETGGSGSGEETTKYSVTYSYGGTTPTDAPEVPTESEHAAGETVTVKSNPESVEGYTFSGWSTSDATVENGKFEMPAKNVTLTGTWTVDPSVLKSIAVSIAAPAVGGGKPAPTINTSGVTAGTPSWTGTFDDNNKFKAGESYSVSIPATADTGKTFVSTLTKDDVTTTNGTVKSATLAENSVTIVIEFGTFTNSITSVTLPLTAPAKDQTAATTITSDTAGVNSATVSWSPSLSSGKFAQSTEYTATITVTTSAGYEFGGTGGKPSVTLSGSSIPAGEVSLSADKKTMTVTHKYPSTYPVVISAVALSIPKNPVGDENGPNLTIASTDPNKDNLDIIPTTWKKSDGTTVTKLDYNTEYTANVEISVISAKTSECTFASSVTVTKPNQTTDTSKTESVTLSNGKLSLSIKFKTGIDNEIDTVSLTMTAPASGTAVSIQPSLVKPETSAKYSVDSLKWYLGSTELTSGTFEPGKKYTAKIVLKTTDDYVFNSGIKKADVKVNSNTVDEDPSLTDSYKTLSLKYTFSETAKPTITLSADPSSPKIPVGGSQVSVNLRYTITGSYASGSISFGDNSGTTPLSASGSGTLTHSYSKTDTYTVKATVYDKSGVELASRTLSLPVGKDTLTAGFTATPASDNPQKISFAGTTAGNVTWEWDLGDGTKTNEKSFTHIYKKAKDYTVTLTVYSGGLSNTISKTVTVAKGTGSGGDGEPFLIIGDTEVPSPLDIIAEFIRLLLSLFNFEEHPLFPDLGGE